jgi:hypothetical protein
MNEEVKPMLSFYEKMNALSELTENDIFTK